MASSNTPKDLIAAAIAVDSVAQLKEALNQLRSTSPSTYKDDVKSALQSAVQQGAVATTNYFFEEEDVYMADVTILDIVAHPSIPLFEALLECGWDVNTAGAQNSLYKGKRPIDWLCANHELVEWLVEHDAAVDGGEDEYPGALEPRPPMLLETCALNGSLKTFKLLQSRGAKLSRRTLHVAVHGAAEIGVDPAYPGSDPQLVDASDKEAVDRAKWMKDRAEILNYLVDELHVDVNALETDEDKAMHYGPPLNYAAREPKGAAVVKWLLEKGANPNVTGANGQMRAEDWAKSMKAEKVLEVLQAWKGAE